MEDKIFIAILSAALAAVGTYVAAVLKFRNDLRFEYDKDLRARRIPEYMGLWKLTALFPKHPRSRAVTLAQVRELTINLRDWYFHSGMFLSDDGRDAYFKYQKALCDVVEEAGAGDLNRELDGANYERLRLSGSDLRSTLVRDVGTRSHSELESIAKEKKRAQAASAS